MQVNMIHRLLAGMLFFALPLLADRTGPYLGLGAGLSHYNDDGRLRSIDTEYTTAYRFYAGAFINEYLSVEIDYTYLKAFSGTSESGSSIEEKFEALTVAALAHYPVWEERIDWFAKFGAGELFWGESETSQEQGDSTGTLLFGAGVGYRPIDRLTFNLGYDYYIFDLVSQGSESDASARRYEMGIGSVYLEVEVQF
jgi:opacity protein-like surface antigen